MLGLRLKLPDKAKQFTGKCALQLTHLNELVLQRVVHCHKAGLIAQAGDTDDGLFATLRIPVIVTLPVVIKRQRLYAKT